MAEPIVWVVDREHWPRVYLRAELLERGFDARGYANLSEALEHLTRAGVAAPRVILLVVRQQRFTPALLEALARTAIPVVLVTGAAESRDVTPEARQWAAVLRRPVTIGQVADTIQQVFRDTVGR